MTEYGMEERYVCIRGGALRAVGCDPVRIARELMALDCVQMHGPEHHFLDGAAFLAAYRNAGGPIELGQALDELAKRAAKMPGAMCGQWGICGSVASVGAALSVVHGTGPLSTDKFYADHMAYTAAVLARMSELGGARCCKRNAYLALTAGAAFVRERYGIPMEAAPIVCGDFSRNRQCIGARCPFHP